MTNGTSRIILAAAILAGAASLAGAATIDDVKALLDKAASSPLTAEETASLAQGLNNLADSADTLPADLRDLAKRASGLLTAEQRAAVAGKLQTRLAGTPDAAAALVTDNLVQAVITLDWLSAPAARTQLVLKWIAASDKWKSATAPQLLRVLWALEGAAGQDAQVVGGVVTHSWTTYISAAADASKATAPEYVSLAKYVHVKLTADQQKELSTSLVARLTQTPASTAQLGMADIRNARDILGNIQNQLAIADIIAAWMKACEKYKQVGPADLGYLADFLRPKAGLFQEQIDQLLAQARSRNLFSDAQAATNGDPADWLSLVRGMRWFMTAADKAAASAVLASAFNQTVCARFTGVQLSQLIGALGEMGMKPQASDTLASWLAANSLQNLDSLQLSAAASCFDVVGTAGATDQKSSLGSLIWEKYLGTNDYVAKADPVQLWGLITNVAGVLSTEQKGQLAAKLQQQFPAEDSALAGMKLNAVLCHAQSLGLVGKSGEAADLLVRWLAAGEGWKQAGSYDLMTIAQILRGRLATDADRQRAQQWATKAYQASLAAMADNPQPGLLFGVAKFMEQVEFLGKGKGYQDFAVALAKGLKAGNPAGYDQECRMLAGPLGTLETRATLTAELTDGNGVIRRDVARILAWAYSQYQSWDDWRKLIDQKLSDQTLAGDQKASWLLARADAEAAKGGTVSPLAGKQWLEQALDAAQTDALKLQCVETLALGYVETLQEQQAKTFLAGVQGSFTAPESAQKFQAISAKADALAKQFKADEAAGRASAEDRAKTAYLAELKRRLAEARGKGDQEGIRRYERLLAEQK